MTKHRTDDRPQPDTGHARTLRRHMRIRIQAQVIINRHQRWGPVEDDDDEMIPYTGPITLRMPDEYVPPRSPLSRPPRQP